MGSDSNSDRSVFREKFSFVARYLLFLIPIGVVFLWLEGSARKLPDDFRFKKSQLELQLDSIETLILGQSHTKVGLNPDLMDGWTYNLAERVQTLYFDSYLLNYYIDRMPNLKRVIVPISYQSLGGESNLAKGEYNRSYLYAFYYGSTKFTSPFNPRRYSLVLNWEIHNVVDRLYDEKFGAPLEYKIRSNGWEPRVGTTDLVENATNSPALFDQYLDESLYPDNVAYLKDMTELCERNEVQLYLFSPPMHKLYMENVTQSRYEDMVRIATEFSAEYDVPYFNDTYLDIFPDSEFYDANHLNVDGAERWTRLVNDRILEVESRGVR